MSYNQGQESLKDKMADAMRTGAVIMAVVMGISGVASVFGSKTIEDGNFGIEKSFSGTYQTETLKPGINLNIIDKIFEIYGKESLVRIENVKPKDADGIMLQDLDLNVAIKVNSENAVPFLLKTGDITYNKEKGVYVLGQNYIEKEARSVASQTIRKFRSEELIDRQQDVENQIKADFQKQLDELYGKGTFTVSEIKIANVQLSPAIEQKIQSIEEIKAEEAKAAATEKIVGIRAGALKKDAEAYQEVAKQIGWNPQQLMEFQKTQAMIQGKLAGATVQVPLSAPAPK